MFLLGHGALRRGRGSPALPAVGAGGRAQTPRSLLRLRCGSAGRSERGIIALVMQDVDNSITVFGERTRTGRFRLRSRQGEGEPNPTWIPVANERVAAAGPTARAGGAFGNVGEVIDAPMTAHFIGGAVIGADAAARRHRPLPPGARLPDAARRGRARRSRRTRGEPVADHHRDGRARDGAVAERGSAGRPAGGRLGHATRRSPRSRPRHRSCPPGRPVSCGSPSTWASRVARGSRTAHPSDATAGSTAITRGAARRLAAVSTPRPVLVVDFGAQYAQLIARRVREARVLLRDRALDDARGARCWPRTRPR